MSTRTDTDPAVLDRAPGAGDRLREVHRDQQGAVVSAFVVRAVIIFIVLIIAVEEVGQVVLTQISASNAAGAAAQAAADDYDLTKNANHASRVAVATLAEQDPKATITAFSVDRSGTVTVTVAQKSSTLFIQYLPYLKDHQVQHATEQEFHSLA
jgi:Flp pilus assembly protein TadG